VLFAVITTSINNIDVQSVRFLTHLWMLYIMEAHVFFSTVLLRSKLNFMNSTLTTIKGWIRCDYF